MWTKEILFEQHVPITPLPPPRRYTLHDSSSVQGTLFVAPERLGHDLEGVFAIHELSITKPMMRAVCEFRSEKGYEGCTVGVCALQPGINRLSQSFKLWSLYDWMAHEANNLAKGSAPADQHEHSLCILCGLPRVYP